MKSKVIPVMLRQFAGLFGLAATLCVPLPARAQDPGNPVHVSRDSLSQVILRLDETANSSAYSEALRQRARREAELLRNRLSQGDFQTGDRILLAVEGQAELTDTFTVAPGPTLMLPTIREVPLKGLLRSELQAHLEQHLKRFFVDPKVKATPLMRIWIEGGVNTPGVYLVPAEALVTDALMVAGGTTREARVTGVRIERDNVRIWEGEALQRAITEGRTLDQLSLRAGDHIIVEEGRGGFFSRAGTIIMTLVPLALLAAQLF
jgi:protein involved in polysaccharide export with SLBB domain